MRIRSIVFAAILSLVAAVAASGQALPSASLGGGDVALTYHYVRTNTLGQCGCFSLTGLGLSAAWYFRPPLAAVAEASVEHTAQGPSGGSLTLTSYLAGARYLLRHSGETTGIQPFAEILAGMGHAGGGVAGPGDKSNSLVARVGGGIDLPVSPRFAIRVIRFDYDLTTFNNGVNNHQNNLLIATGIIYKWGQ